MFSHLTTTTDIYTLSLHDALPILNDLRYAQKSITIEGYIFAVDRLTQDLLKELEQARGRGCSVKLIVDGFGSRSEEHTSELQSRQYLVCRLLLEKKKHSLVSQSVN